MNSELGSGGRTNIASSSIAAAISERPASARMSSPDSATVRPPMRCRASRSGGKALERGAHIIHQRRADDVLRRDELDQPAASGVVGPERLGQQILDVEHLDAALTHPSDELVVLPLRALDPQDVIEQQLVVVGRGQPPEAEVRPVDDDLAQLADFRVDAEGGGRRGPGRARRGGRGHRVSLVWAVRRGARWRSCWSKPMTASRSAWRLSWGAPVRDPVRYDPLHRSVRAGGIHRTG